MATVHQVRVMLVAVACLVVLVLCPYIASSGLIRALLRWDSVSTAEGADHDRYWHSTGIGRATRLGPMYALPQVKNTAKVLPQVMDTAKALPQVMDTAKATGVGHNAGPVSGIRAMSNPIANPSTVSRVSRETPGHGEPATRAPASRQSPGSGPPGEAERKAFASYSESLRALGADTYAKLNQYTCRFVEDHSAPSTPYNPTDVAIVSLLSASVASLRERYVLGLEVLGSSLEKHAPKDIPRVLMLLEGTPCDELCIRRLHDTGWRICHVPHINPPHPSDFQRFKDQFVKLAMWNMVQYRRIVYMDADTLAVGNLSRLLSTNVSVASRAPLAVAQDISAGRWVSGFNMGVAVIPTNRSEFVRLFDLVTSDAVTYQRTMSEQGFLSVVYKGLWRKLAFEDNANLAAWLWDRALWLRKRSEIRLVHYTMEKGWEITAKSSYAEIGKHWTQTRDLLCTRRCKSASTCGLAKPTGCDCSKVAGTVCGAAASSNQL